MPPPPPDGANWSGQYGRQMFGQLLSEAIADLSATGFVSPERIEAWITRLRNAAEREIGPDALLDEQTKARLGAIFDRLTNTDRLAKVVPGVTRFNISIVKPYLRAELDRRIWANADQIKLNKRDAVERTLQRFHGWSTSIPPGGDDTISRREVKADIGKSIAQFKYVRRRCDTDQGMKLLANISDIVATDAGAIAGVWHDHGEHDKSYNARKEHMARAGKTFVIRDSWAVREGLINKGDGYTDEITAPAQEVSCRCFYRYITSPRRLPEEMLTAKGRAWVERGRLKAEGVTP